MDIDEQIKAKELEIKELKSLKKDTVEEVPQSSVVLGDGSQKGIEPTVKSRSVKTDRFRICYACGRDLAEVRELNTELDQEVRK